MCHSRRCAFALFVLALALARLTQPAVAQPTKPPKAPAEKQQDPLLSISQAGPFTADLGTVAQVQVPPNYRFVGKENIRRFNEMTQNLTAPNEVGVLVPSGAPNWYIMFSFSGDGYVKDDEKDELDAAALLKSMQEGEKEANKERQRLGIPNLELVGWEKPPFYDSKTNNLTWALKLRSERQQSINYNSRILGRGGYMSANLVVGPAELNSAIPEYEQVLKGFAYKDGQRYSDWLAGDKVAPLGLAALVAGGAGVAAAKTGLLAKLFGLLAKGGKLVVVALIALAAGIGAFLKKIFGGGSQSEPTPDEPGEPATGA